MEKRIWHAHVDSGRAAEDGLPEMNLSKVLHWRAHPRNNAEEERPVLASSEAPEATSKARFPAI